MTAPVDTNETSVRKSVTVNAPIDRAFEASTKARRWETMPLEEFSRGVSRLLAT